jgi:uncharacterized protein YoxC
VSSSRDEFVFSIDVCPEKFFKKLIGNTEVEDALQRLDKLTLEEAHMAAAELLRISHNVESRVIRVDEGVQDVGKGVEDVGGKVEGVDKKVQEVDDKVECVDKKVQEVSDTVQGVGDGVQGVRKTVQGVDDKVVQFNRESSPNVIALALQFSQISTGNHLRERLQTWLSPPNPSTNHNIACDAQHEGTAQWFFRGSIFNQWKSSDPFLWVYGKRVFLLCF